MFSVRTGLRLLILGVVCPIFMSSCTPTLTWVKPGAEPGSADQQQATCALQAETSYINSDESAEARAARIAKWTSLCMRASGFKQQEVVAQEALP